MAPAGHRRTRPSAFSVHRCHWLVTAWASSCGSETGEGEHHAGSGSLSFVCTTLVAVTFAPVTQSNAESDLSPMEGCLPRRTDQDRQTCRWRR